MAADFLQQIQPRVTAQMNTSLVKPVTENEVFQALQMMDVDKAPGPYGFTIGFYKDYWQTIKSSLVSLIQTFMDTLERDPALNHTHICLVPKIENPISVRDYRPISLSNVAYKLLSKVLSERLKPILHSIISENQ